MISHNAPSVYIDNWVPFRCSTYEVEHDGFGRIWWQTSNGIRRGSTIVKFIQVVNETCPILIIEKYLPFIDTAIQ